MPASLQDMARIWLAEQPFRQQQAAMAASQPADSQEFVRMRLTWRAAAVVCCCSSSCRSCSCSSSGSYWLSLWKQHGSLHLDAETCQRRQPLHCVHPTWHAHAAPSHRHSNQAIKQLAAADGWCWNLMVTVFHAAAAAAAVAVFTSLLLFLLLQVRRLRCLQSMMGQKTKKV